MGAHIKFGKSGPQVIGLDKPKEYIQFTKDGPVAVTEKKKTVGGHIKFTKDGPVAVQGSNPKVKKVVRKSVKPDQDQLPAAD